MLVLVCSCDRMGGATMSSLLHSKLGVQVTMAGSVASQVPRLDTGGVQVKVGGLVKTYLIQGLVQVVRQHMHLEQLKELKAQVHRLDSGHCVCR